MSTIWPVIENFRGTQPVEAGKTVPGEIETIAPEHAGWRVREFALFKSGVAAAWCAELRIATIGYREIQRVRRESFLDGEEVLC